MHGRLAVAALSVAFLTMPAWSQRHGGGTAGFRGHAGFAPHGAFGGLRGSGFAGAPRAGMSWGWGFHGGFFGRGFGPGWGFRGWPFFHHHHYWYPWYSGYYGGYGYPWWGVSSYAGYPLEYYPSESYLSAFNPQAAEIQRQQQAEIARLNDEVARLREQEARPALPPEPRSSKSSLETTQLVFSDHHTEEVQNYAIVGPTLWVFTEQRARKILLSDLDIPATTKANDDRGVDFHLPQSMPR